MASVTSLDKDMRKLRFEKYTPQAAKECREWIESILGEYLPSGDLLDAIKDGVALCRLANLALPPPGIKYKQSSMPFIQMENISHFLRACQRAPLSLQPHDVFLTVDLYEQKDPAQVLQCLGAFSRVANQVAPSQFPTVIGPKSRPGLISPQDTGPHATGGASYVNRGRGISNASNTSSAYSSVSKTAGSLTPSKTGGSGSGRWSPTKNGTVQLSPGSVSSWSKKSDEVNTAPAWNINQYGYMGGASQGNMGISFGGRRQITSAGPYIPNMAEKEKERKEKEADELKTRLQMEEEERQRRLERDAEEERVRIAEEARWEETRKLREKEKARQEEERRRWEEEEKKWKLDEEKRQREDREAEARLEKERRRLRDNYDPRLQGQFLSQYQAENGISSGNNEIRRVKELERELELARERERQYERERLERTRKQDYSSTSDEHDISFELESEDSKTRAQPQSRAQVPLRNDKDETRRKDGQEHFQHKLNEHVEQLTIAPRPLPDPTPLVQLKPNHANPPSSRPLPDPASYVSPKVPSIPSASGCSNPTTDVSSRTDRYLASNPAPTQAQAQITFASELGAFDSSAERDAEDRRRAASQAKTKAGGWASKSLLEREMELERQRQREWEEGQKATAEAAKKGFPKDGVDGIGGDIDGRFDKGQWAGYTGGDNQNKGSQGIGAGRRQIVGPRPLPGR